jgi:hypothetical protein
MVSCGEVAKQENATQMMIITMLAVMETLNRRGGTVGLNLHIGCVLSSRYTLRPSYEICSE